MISSVFLNTPYDGAARSNTSSRHRKRKLTPPTSFENDERTVFANKKRKKTENYFDDIVIMDNDFSLDLDLPLSEDNDIFDWMDNILGKEADELPPIQGNEKNSSESTDIHSFLSQNGSDSCYDEMISLLAEGDENNSSNGEENVFKKIQESFIADQLLGDHSKTFKLKRSPSFTRLGRSSRLGIRQGLAKLAKANSQSAKTRRMLLSCRLSFSKKSSQ